MHKLKLCSCFGGKQLTAYTRCDVIANFGKGSPSEWSTPPQLLLSHSHRLPVPQLFIDHYTQLSMQQPSVALSKPE